MINLLGQMTLTPFESAFVAADRLVEEARRETPVVFVDFHAEATSEKVALARYLDGRVTAVARHAHARPDGRRARARGRHRGDDRRRHDRPARLRDRLASPRARSAASSPACPTRLEPATGDVRIEGALVECGADGRATRAWPCASPAG